jgi:hypothetical protein
MTVSMVLSGGVIDLGDEREVDIQATRGFGHAVHITITIAPAEFTLTLTDGEDARRIGLELIEAANAIAADRRKDSVPTPG